MLFDLTAISRQRAAQVDELHVGGRLWVSSTTAFIALGGMISGVLAGEIIRFTLAPGELWPFLAVPILGLAAVILFARPRSQEGETTSSRAKRMIARHTTLDGEFLLPGSMTPYDPNRHDVAFIHDHPLGKPDF